MSEISYCQNIVRQWSTPKACVDRYVNRYVCLLFGSKVVCRSMSDVHDVIPTQAVWAAGMTSLTHESIRLSVCIGRPTWRSGLQHRQTWIAIKGSVWQPFALSPLTRSAEDTPHSFAQKTEKVNTLYAGKIFYYSFVKRIHECCLSTTIPDSCTLTWL